jgi:hypothetical protein
MWREGRLNFNSNLRLFTNCRSSIPKMWICNALNAVFLVASYSSTSLVFVGKGTQLMAEATDDAESCFDTDPHVNKMPASGVAMVILGSGLLGQAFLATWSYCTVKVPTWSSSPINNALACQQQGTERHKRCTMLSVGDSPPSVPSHPLQRQKCAWAAHHEIRYVLRFLWVLFALGTLWTSAVAIGIRRRSQ